MKVTALLFYLCFGFCVSVLHSNVNENQENCRTFNGTLGECIAIQNCPSLLSISKQSPLSPGNSYLLILSLCGGDGESKVCCDNNDDNIEFAEDVKPKAIPRFLGSSKSSRNSCSTPDGQDGKCIPTKDCPPLLNKLKNFSFTTELRDFFIKVGCGFEGNDPMVCCANTPMQSPLDNIPTESIESDLLPGTDTCGIMFADKIVGGLIAEIGEFPWMALLEYRTESGSQFNCGGSLINNRYVLTAAHCIKDSLVSVRLGEYDINSTKDCGYCEESVDVEVAETVVHESYFGNTNDIALVRLAKAVTYTDFIRPICIPTTVDLLSQTYQGINMTVAGWGITENATSSNILRKLQVPVKKIADCSVLYGPKMVILPSLLCAGGERGQDSCQGDSGGPLMATHHVNIYAAGIVSFGSGRCGIENWPGVYTKLSYYAKWLVSKLKP